MAERLRAEFVMDSFMEVMFSLMMEHHHKQIAKLELTVPQVHALKLLRRGPLCTGDLATRLSISAPAVTQLTDRLFRKDFIERRMADGDRRSVLVALTGKGRRAVDRVRERRNEIFISALALIDQDEQQAVVEALGKVVSALERYGAETAIDAKPASNRSSRPSKRARPVTAKK